MSASAREKRLFIATNNGDISGGENMLFNIARAARDLGREVTVIGPTAPDDVLERASHEGFDCVEISAASRQQYVLGLSAFGMRHRRELMWCNGLIPSFALSAHPRRIVHLHQIPMGANAAFSRVALLRQAPRLVPSRFAAARIPGSEVFPNWVPEVRPDGPRKPDAGPLRIGFMGRVSPRKGIVTLAKACQRLIDSGSDIEVHVVGGQKHMEQEHKNMVAQALDSLPGHRLIRHGEMPPESFYHQIDLMVVPSEWGEVFGLVAAEAMSARVPLVVSDDGGLPEVVGPNHPWSFTAADDHALTETLGQAIGDLQNSPESVRSETERAHDRWRSLYSPEAGLQRTREVLESIDRCE